MVGMHSRRSRAIRGRCDVTRIVEARVWRIREIVVACQWLRGNGGNEKKKERKKIEFRNGERKREKMQQHVYRVR